MKKIEIDDKAKIILEKLEENGYKAYVVGGCVRDYIMGIIPKDIDITTSAKPTDIKRIFKKTIDTGIEHGTVTVLIEKEPFEVTTFRIDGDYINNRKPESVIFTDDVYEDMLRRDFTMNAICYNDKEGFVDHFDGFLDIENKIIRGVGEPSKRFTEDALRMLRAIRFSGTTNFIIEENTYNAIIEKRELIKNISVERIREEFTKLLLSNNNEKVELLVTTKLIKYYRENLYNYMKNNMIDIIDYLKYSKKDIAYLYTALFIKMPSENVLTELKALKFDNKTIKAVHQISIYLSKNIEKTPYFIRKMVSEVGEYNAKAILYFKEKLDNESYEKELNEINLISKNGYPINIKDLCVDGNFLKEKGITDGKEIGLCLKKLLDIVLENPNLNEIDVLSEYI